MRNDHIGNRLTSPCIRRDSRESAIRTSPPHVLNEQMQGTVSRIDRLVRRTIAIAVGMIRQWGDACFNKRSVACGTKPHECPGTTSKSKGSTEIARNTVHIGVGSAITVNITVLHDK